MGDYNQYQLRREAQRQLAEEFPLACNDLFVNAPTIGQLKATTRLQQQL
jgi:hypothetical protein